MAKIVVGCLFASLIPGWVSAQPQFRAAGGRSRLANLAAEMEIGAIP
jgi:hypothetical protein